MNCEVFESDFTFSELKSALKKCKKGKAAGPDRITNEMINNLSDYELTTILDLINKTWREGKLPTAWRKANTIPILKNDRNPNEITSYRPISLTSNLGKVAERMINDRLYWWLESSKIINTNQSGFRKNKQTIDQLIRLTQDIGDAYQEKKSVLATFIDLKQAYDRVWRTGLFFKIKKMGISGKLYNWLKGFFQNRTIQTTYNGSSSKQRTLEEGLPQGSALSCTLFLIYINDLPDVITCQKALFADDLVIWTKGIYPKTIINNINKNLTTISAYCELWKLEMNREKTVYSLFSLNTKAKGEDMESKIGGIKIAYEKFPRYLGVELDQRLTMEHYIENLIKKTTTRIKLIKHLASCKWGADFQACANYTLDDTSDQQLTTHFLYRQ